MFDIPTQAGRNDGNNFLVIKGYIAADFWIRQVGHVDSQKPVAIRLSGETILEEHCYFDNKDGRVMLYAIQDSVTVRGVLHFATKYQAFHTSCRSSMAGKFLPGKVTGSGQVFE